MKGFPNWGSILSPTPFCLPGCCIVIYWRPLLTRAHGRSSNTRKKMPPAIDPGVRLPELSRAFIREPGAAALPFFFLSSASQVIPPGWAPLPEVTGRAPGVTERRGGALLCLQPFPVDPYPGRRPGGGAGHFGPQAFEQIFGS